jgi:hypothetical protein
MIADAVEFNSEIQITFIRPTSGLSQSKHYWCDCVTSYVTSDSVVLSLDRRLELSRIAQSRSLPSGDVFRAKLMLMLAEGASAPR